MLFIDYKNNTLLIYFDFITLHASINYNMYIYIYYLLITICTHIYIIISLHHILFTKYNKYTQYMLFSNNDMYTHINNFCHKIQCLIVRE